MPGAPRLASRSAFPGAGRRGEGPIEFASSTSSRYACSASSVFPLLSSAMNEAAALMVDDQAQFEAAIDAVVRRMDASFRERHLRG